MRSAALRGGDSCPGTAVAKETDITQEDTRLRLDAAVLVPPLGDDDCECHVGDNHTRGDGAEVPIVPYQEIRSDEANLEKDRKDLECDVPEEVAVCSGGRGGAQRHNQVSRGWGEE